MQIPKTIKVRNTQYAVRTTPALDQKSLGMIHYDDKYIVVATHNLRSGKRRTERQQAQTFWHEMTHAILRDMGHRLADNEELSLIHI
jgi:hypothetical protein